jgi:hypothetical protein
MTPLIFYHTEKIIHSQSVLGMDEATFEDLAFGF